VRYESPEIVELGDAQSLVLGCDCSGCDCGADGGTKKPSDTVTNFED
jgi:hypothetical protein